MNPMKTTMKAIGAAIMIILAAGSAQASARRVAKPAKPSPAAAARIAKIQAMYNKGTLNRAFTTIQDPDKTRALRNTKALSVYRATIGESKNLDLVSDGDHDMFKARAKSGEWLLLTYPEDSGRGDGVWLFDKSGMKQIAAGTAHNGKLRTLKAAK